MNFPFNINMPQQQNSSNIDINKMKEWMPRVTKDNLVQLVQQARAQGIPEPQIEAGLNFLLGLK